MENKTVIKTGGSLSIFAFIVFLVLKLAEIGVVATWSWWWVFSPLWIPFAAVVAFLIVFLIGYLLVNIKFKRKKR